MAPSLAAGLPPDPSPCSWLAPVLALPERAWLPGSVPSAFPAAATLRVIRPPADPARIGYPLLCPTPRLGSATSELPPAVASRFPSSARNSWLCACSRCPSPCSRPVPLAPTSSSRSLTSAVTSAETVLPAPSNAVSENPRWCGSPAHSPLPILEKRRPPPIASGSCVTKIPPRNNHRAGSWSSCAGDTAAGPDLPLHTRSRSPKGPVGPPRRIRNRKGGHPATTHEDSQVTANSVLEGSCEMFLPCSKNWHTLWLLFKQIQRNRGQFSDTLLAA